LAYIFATISTLAPIVGEDAYRRAAGNLGNVKVEDVFVEVRVDDENVLGGCLNEGVQVAIKVVFFALLVDTFDLFFRELSEEVN